MDERKYYVYGYYRFDKNSFFYIGKGKGDRYKCIQNRSKHFMNIINKIPYTVFILYNNLTEDEAFQYEEETIENLVEYGYSIDIKGYDKKEKHLTNQCWGGKGGLGGVPKNNYVKQCVAESNRKRRGKNSATSKSVILLNTKEYFECLTDGAKKYNISEPSISNCCNNKSSCAGKYNGERLVWVFEEDFKNMSKKDIENKIFIAQKSGNRKGGYNSFYGKTHSRESREKMSKKRKGKKASQETKEKLSNMRKNEGNSMWGRKGELSPHWGKEYSEDHRNNISKSLGTAVKCIELNIEFNSLNKAEIYMIKTYNIKFSHKTLKATIEKQRKKDWYGEIKINGELVKLHWEYC